MLQSAWMLQRLAQDQQRDLMRQLEQQQLIRQLALTRYPPQHRVYHMLDWIGRQLVAWGERLQARHAQYHQETLNHSLGGRV